MRLLILGTSGTGKSWFAGSIIEDAAQLTDAAIHYDIEDEEKGLCVEGGLYTSLYVDKEMFEEGAGKFVARALQKYKRIRVVPEGLDEEELVELGGVIASLAMKFGENTDKDTGIFVSIDEAHQIAPEGKLDSRISRMATGGRKHNVDWLICTQRPQLIDKTILTQTDYLVSFAVKDTDISKMQDSVSFNADRLKELPARTAILENLGNGDIEEIDTNTLTRTHPHIAAEGGKTDEAVDSLFG